MSQNLESVLEKATEGHRIVPDDWMPTGSIRPIILGDPGEVWLEFHGESHDLRPDLLSPYSFFEFIADKGRGFKQKWVKENVKGASQVCEEDYHVRYADKLRQTLRLMFDKQPAPVIVQPALWWAPERIYGVPDLLVHTSWLRDNFEKAWQELKDHTPSGEVPDGYVIFELRFTTRDADKRDTDSVKAAKAQIRLNTYILGQLQGWMPSRSFLITRKTVNQPEAMGIGSQLNQPLDNDLGDFRDQFLEIKLNGDQLVPWRDEGVRADIKNPGERWKTAKKLIAWEKTPGGDLRVLPRIGVDQERQLAEQGFADLDALLKKPPSKSFLADKVDGVGGKTADQIRAILQANRTAIPVLPKAEPSSFEKKFEFFVDFEYFSNLNVDFKKDWPRLRGCEMLFMIGVGWQEQDGWEFRTFAAEKEEREHERKMIEDFLAFLDTKTNGAYTEKDKTVLFHWSNAEVSQSRRAANRHDFAKDHPFRRLPWFDLRKGAFLEGPGAVPGAWTYGLKPVAKALGGLDDAFDPEWVGVLDAGLGAMVMGWKAYENSSPTGSDEMKILMQYLEADCKALWCVLQWMRIGAPGLSFNEPDQSYVGWKKVKKGFSRPKAEPGYVAFNDGKGVFVYLQPVLSKRKQTGIKKVQHLIWGDRVSVLESHAAWRKIYSRGTIGWVHRKFIQPERLLEVNFVDVGQGDGCFIVTPEDTFILIDAGEEDHMYRFLRWRFPHFKQLINFEAAIITHPDQDHYYGFRKFFDKKGKAVQNVTFDCIYHNGIIERKAKDLGPSITDAAGDRYLTDIVTDQQALDDLLSVTKRGGRFLQLIRNARKSQRVQDISMLGAGKTEPTYMPGYEKDKPVSIQVLAPVPEGPSGANHLRWFDNNAGKTKNGHSVVLRLKYGKVSMLLGGDLNIPAEEYLLGHYGGITEPFEELTEEKKETMITQARGFFGSDIAKSCHHGSADFSSEFLRAVDAVAVVVSSGDNEPHSHPRPEALGALGKHGRGGRPLIFSTELARSAKENIKHTYSLRQRLTKAIEDNREIEFIDGLIQELGRSVAVYGMITVRTDGENVVIAQKMEQPGSGGRKWELHVLSPDDEGRLQYSSKHGD